METMTLKNGEEVKLKLEYYNIFKFRRENKEIARDVLTAVQNGNDGVDTETAIQTIYVAYLGGANDSKLTYDQFLYELDYNLQEHMEIFNKLITPPKKASSKKR